MKHSLLLSLLMIVCLGVFGQSASVPPQKVTLDQLQTTVDSQRSTIEMQQSSITALQDTIRNLQLQIKELKGEVNNVSEDNSRMNTNMAFWLAILTITMALLGIGFGIIAPLGINRESAKNAHKAKLLANKAKEQVTLAQNAADETKKRAIQAQLEATSAKGQAEQAKEAAEKTKKNAAQAAADASTAKADAEKVAQVETEVKKHGDDILAIQTNITNTAAEAENGFKKAKAIQYFIQALQENDPDRAIDYYTKCIDEDPEFADAYNNRGYLRYKKGIINDAKQDFESAITKKEKFAEAFNNLGILLFSEEIYDDAEKNFNLAGEYAEAKLNLGLLKYAKGDDYEAGRYFYLAIKLKPNYADAYYIWRLFNFHCGGNQQDIEDIIKAKEYKPNVIEAYPNRNLLRSKMKEWDNSFNGVEYSRDFKILKRVLIDKEGKFEIPESVTEIGIGAFYKCTNLTSIKIPNSVTVIGNSAFEHCTNLTSIMIPNSVTNIGYGAFSNCTNLTSIEIPNSVTVIGDSAFSNCTNLTSIEIPNSVTVIGDSAFFFCFDLNIIHLRHPSPIDFSHAFEGLYESKITLYVPKGSVEKYKKHKFYSRFKEIKGE